MSRRQRGTRRINREFLVHAIVAVQALNEVEAAWKIRALLENCRIEAIASTEDHLAEECTAVN